MFEELVNLNIDDYCYILAFDFLDAVSHDLVHFDKKFSKIYENKSLQFLHENISLIDKNQTVTDYSNLIKNFDLFLEKHFYNEKLIHQFQIYSKADLIKHFKHSEPKLIETEIKDKDINILN